MIDTTTATDWVERARAVAPLVREYRDACELERRLVKPLHEVLRQQGFFRLMLPRQLGGEEVDLVTGMRVIEELSRQDGSVGWTVMIGTHWSVIADYFPEGMRGTGSHDVQIHGVFVPTERTLPRGDLAKGPTSRPGVAYHQPLLPHLGAPTMAAVALGIGRDAIDSFVELAGSKVQYMGSMPLVEHHTVHDRVGRAEALLRSGRAFLYEAAREVMTAIDDGADLEAVAAITRLAGAQATQSAAQAVDLMFDAGGGSTIYTRSRLERCFRDVHIVSHHVMASPTHFEMVGQYILGRGLQFRR